MNLQPLADRVIVEVLEGEETTGSGIVLPDTAKEKPQRGRVLAVGQGRYEDGKLIPLDVELGDEVVYSIVGEQEADIKKGLISISAPVARALIGREAGDTVTVRTPKGQREYEILAVEFKEL